MKTSFGKLAMMALVLALCLMLLGPMRSGVEDSLVASASRLSLDPGSTAVVSYTLKAETAQTVAYSSDDPSVAAVDQRGQVTAMAPGKTRVRLTAQGGATASVEVDVTGVAVTSFALNTDLLEMNKGEVSGLSGQFNRGATAQSVTWTSADPSIVQVDGAGRVSAVGGGETYVVATTAGGLSASARVRVYVAATAVQIAPGDMRVGVGTTFQLQARYLPEDATDEAVQWKSSAPEVLSVDADGLMRAVSVGTATVTVSTRQGLKGSTEIVVEPASKDFQISATSVTIERGDRHALSVSFIGADGQVDDAVEHHVEWTVSNPDVVSVSDGVVTGLSSGTAAVTASADGFRSVCTVRVETPVKEVALNMTELYLLKEQTNESFQLRAETTPSDADDTSVAYATDNPLVANVTPSGLVTLTGGYGTAVITATAKSGAEATFAVHVVVALPEPTGSAEPEMEN